MKVQVYMQDYKVKKIDNYSKKEPVIIFVNETKKISTQKDYIHNMISLPYTMYL